MLHLSSNKRIAVNTLLLYLRMFITLGIGLYTSRIVLKVLGFEDYGLNNVVGGIIAMFAFINNAMINSTSRFLTYAIGEKNDRSVNDVFCASIYIHFLIAILLIILGETIGLWFLDNKIVIPEGRSFAARWLYQLSILSAVVQVVSVPYNAAIIAYEKMSAFAYLSILDASLKLVIVLLLQFTPYDKLIVYASLLCAISILDRIIYGIYCKRNFDTCLFHIKWNQNLFKRMLAFAGWSTFGNFSFLFYTHGLNIILNLFGGTVVNAARGIAVQVEGVLRQFFINVQTAINPQIIKSYAQNDFDRTKMLMFASSKYCAFLFFFIALPIMIETPFILRLWLENYPEHTINFIRLTLLISMFDILINPLFTVNVASGKIRDYQLGFCSVTFLFMPIVYFATKYTGVPEIVFATTIIMNSVALIVRLIVTKRKLTFSYREYLKNVVFRLMLIFVISSGVMLYISNNLNENIFRLVVTIGCSSILLSILIYSIGLNCSERFFVKNKIKQFLGKMKCKKSL